MEFHKNILKIDAAEVTEELTELIRKQIRQDLKREGAVVGISGGIDSTVVATLCTRALEPDKVLGVIMPETDSSPESRKLAEDLARHLGIEFVVENITGALDGFKCYQRRNEAIKQVFPDFKPEYKTKITIGSKPLEGDTLSYFKLTMEKPGGEEKSKRLPLKQYLQVVAASNFKQRTRMSTLYYHAERLNRAVVGTGNKDEHELGFFVKYGDGGADLKPIAHLFKMQVFQLAEYLKVPEDIRRRIPTTDTYSAEVTQTDFFFGVNFDILDPVWYALEHDIPADKVARELNLSSDQVERIYRDIQQKKRNTTYLRVPPLEYQ
ncbi:MAG: NAD(+) synthase [candidate division Zixibacteria bacterium]|nr:NAD(+) synthase [candidate division Zixibacteria bacterium]MDD5426618.1 NAD(+) synthase [candidate division Zixibacteria bacterium]